MKRICFVNVVFHRFEQKCKSHQRDVFVGVGHIVLADQCWTTDPNTHSECYGLNYRELLDALWTDMVNIEYGFIMFCFL